MWHTEQPHRANVATIAGHDRAGRWCLGRACVWQIRLRGCDSRLFDQHDAGDEGDVQAYIW